VIRFRYTSSLFVIALGISATSASAATRPSMHVSPSLVSPGGRVTVWGNADGCPGGDAVTIISRAFPGHGFAGIGAITAHVRTGGSFSATGRVRADAHKGRYGITARCGGGNLGVLVYLRVR
jgi:hypothetical protein